MSQGRPTRRERLSSAVVVMSNCDTFDRARMEWRVIEYRRARTTCVCGQQNLDGFYVLRNSLNDRRLGPIGSTCIRLFERSDMDSDVNALAQLHVLHEALQSGADDLLPINSKYFSRASLLWLAEDSAFDSNQWNGFDPWRDYEFMLDMFNKVNRGSAGQDRKARVLLDRSIKPYLARLFG